MSHKPDSSYINGLKTGEKNFRSLKLKVRFSIAVTMKKAGKVTNSDLIVIVR